MTQPDRQQFIGGSDAASVMGLSEWRTPVETWLMKTGQHKPTELDRKRERIFDRGRREEPHIINDLVQLCGIKITKRSSVDSPNYHHDAEHGFLAAEIDAEWEVTAEAVNRLKLEHDIDVPEELIGTTQNVEAKTAHPFVASKKFGQEGTDEIPIEYYCQAMHGLMVSGRQLVLVALRVYVDDPILYVVRRDEQHIALMREREVRFWLDYVIPSRTPPPMRLEDVCHLMPKNRPTAKEATPAVAGLIQSLRVLKDRGRITDEGVEAVQFEIGCFLLGAEAMENPKPKDMGKHVITVGGQPALWMSYEEQERIDADALRMKHPLVAAECAKITQFYKFNLKRNKP